MAKVFELQESSSAVVNKYTRVLCNQTNPLQMQIIFKSLISACIYSLLLTAVSPGALGMDKVCSEFLEALSAAGLSLTHLCSIT